ncbi:MAG: response regulator transcription factor [Eggerthella lenta]
MECFGYNTGMLRSREQNGEGVAPPKAGLFSFAQGLALALLTLSSWSLNVHLFPLYDTQLSFIRELCTLANGAALVAVAVVSVRRPRALRRQVLMGIAIFGAAGGSLLVWAGDRLGSMGVMLAGACLVSVAEGACAILVGIALCSVPTKLASICIVTGLLACAGAKQAIAVGYSEFALAVHAALLLGAALLANPTASETMARLSRDESPHDMAITQPSSFLPFGHQLFVCLLLFSAVGFMLTFEKPGAFLPRRSGASRFWRWSCCRMPCSPPVDDRCAFEAGRAACDRGASARSRFGLDSVLHLERFDQLRDRCVRRVPVDRAHGVVLAQHAWCRFGFRLGLRDACHWRHPRSQCRRFVNHYWTSDVQVVVLAVAGIVFCLVVAMSVFLQHFSFEKTINGVRESVPPVLVDSADEDDASEERALTVDERCEVLSQQKGLTKRETEVLHLLARGRTGVFIQHELCVSYNTIKAHVKHIYQKLDVHTHQELIDLVEDLG